MHSKSSVLLIGRGRLAKHLHFWNSQLQSPSILNTWNRSQDISLLNQFLKDKPLIWLAISDSGLIDFYETYLAIHNLKVVHFSGALTDERLYSAHPLMTFAEKIFEPDVYNKIHFVISGFNDLKIALPCFQNTFTIISTFQKPFYHSLCVIAGNFPQLLWNEVIKEMRNLEIPDSALELYIEQISKNFIHAKEAALTGPLVRKDYVTIEKNIHSLEQHSKLKNIYETFDKEFRK